MQWFNEDLIADSFIIFSYNEGKLKVKYNGIYVGCPMSSEFPRLTVDGILTVDDKILLIKRKYDPFKYHWALPGGFVEYGETTANAVCREIKEETGLGTEIISLFDVYSDPQRDPRGHTVSIVYVLKKIGGELHSGDDANDARYFPLDTIPNLAFDHVKILTDFIRRKNDVLPKV